MEAVCVEILKHCSTSIRQLTDEEIQAASVQFVRKLSGFTKPSKVNEIVFEQAVDEVARDFLGSLVTNSPPRNREVEAAKARARIARRFG